MSDEIGSRDAPIGTERRPTDDEADDWIGDAASVIHGHCGSDNSDDAHNDWVNDLANDLWRLVGPGRAAVPLSDEPPADAPAIGSHWWTRGYTNGHWFLRTVTGLRDDTVEYRWMASDGPVGESEMPVSEFMKLMPFETVVPDPPTAFEKFREETQDRGPRKASLDQIVDLVREDRDGGAVLPQPPPQPEPAGLHIECDRCHEALTSPGGLLFTSPYNRLTAKYHLCSPCCNAVLAFIQLPVAAPLSDNETETP